MQPIIKAIEAFFGEPTLKAFFAALGVFGTYIFGFETMELWMIIGVLMIFDVTTGLMKAYRKREELTSRRMFDKLAQGAVYGIVIGTVNMIGRACECLNGECPTQVASLLRSAAAIWIIGTELKSISENLNSMGYRLGFLEDIIQKYFGDKRRGNGGGKK